MKKTLLAFFIFLAFITSVSAQLTFEHAINVRNFQITNINSSNNTITYSFEVLANFSNLEYDIYVNQIGTQQLAVTRSHGAVNSPTSYSPISITSPIRTGYLNELYTPNLMTDKFILRIKGTNAGNSSIFRKVLIYRFYPYDDSYPYNTNTVDVSNFKLDRFEADKQRVHYSFDIRGKYQSLKLYLYEGSIDPSKRLVYNHLNSDRDDPIYYPEYVNYKTWTFMFNFQGSYNYKPKGKYILVIEYTRNGITTTKQLEYTVDVCSEPAWTRSTNVQLKTNTLPFNVSSASHTIYVYDSDCSITKEYSKTVNGINPPNTIMTIRTPIDRRFTLRVSSRVYGAPGQSFTGGGTASYVPGDYSQLELRFPYSNLKTEIYDFQGNLLQTLESVNDEELNEIKKKLPKGIYIFKTDNDSRMISIQ